MAALADAGLKTECKFINRLRGESYSREEYNDLLGRSKLAFNNGWIRNGESIMLASTANFLKGHGWQAGQSWEEGTPNYAVLKDWNRAEVYQRTIAVMASKLREAP